ncbi:MAG: hypothetical protein ACK4TA_17165 [Saprospiraceae bacterium]
MDTHNILKRQIFFLQEEEKNTQKFEQLYAITNPKVLSLAEETAILFDTATDNNGQILFSKILDIVKEQENMSLTATVKKTFSNKKVAVSHVITEVFDSIIQFLGVSLSKEQIQQLRAFTDNIFLNLSEQQDFSWIHWIKKEKNYTTYQYNIFLASDGAEGNIFFYNIPILLNVNIQLSFDDLLKLQPTDQISYDVEIQGIKIAQLTEALF